MNLIIWLIKRSRFYQCIRYKPSNEPFMVYIFFKSILITISRNFELKQFVHFDNDVLIYEPFYKIDEKRVISKIKSILHKMM